MDRIYKVILYRADGNHMEVFESDDLKAVEKAYNWLNAEWVASTAEKRPFTMPSPELHSFIPALITEIKVESMSKEEYLRQDNPFHKQMQKEGFTGVMNRNFTTGR